MDGKTDDEMEAKALINALSLVDIYSGSWGPRDDGLMVDGPGVIAQIAFEIGATQVTNSYVQCIIVKLLLEKSD